MRTAPSGWGLGKSRVMGQTHVHWDSKKAPSSSTVTSCSVTQRVGRFCNRTQWTSYDDGDRIGKQGYGGKSGGRQRGLKEALAELLNKIPAFKALVSGEGALPTRQSGEGPSSADEETSREADGRGEASKGKHSQTCSGATK